MASRQTLRVCATRRRTFSHPGPKWVDWQRPGGALSLHEEEAALSFLGMQPFGYHPEPGGYPDLFNHLLCGLRTKMQASLQQAQPDDQELLLLFMAEYYRFDNLPFDREKAGLALLRLLQEENLGYVWLIRMGEATVGYVVLTLGYSLEYHGRDAFIDEIYLREAFRGQGLGSTVLNLVAEQARRLEVQVLHLEVERENKVAQVIYRKRGYIDHDRYLMTKRIVEETA